MIGTRCDFSSTRSDTKGGVTPFLSYVRSIGLFPQIMGTMRNRFKHLAATLALIVLAGCGESGPPIPELAPVTGTVTQGGKPLEGASVSFWPEGKGSPSISATDAEGRFELKYGGKADGAPLGKHTVRISKMKEEAGNELIPAKYNERSTITKDVTKEGPNDFKIEL